jgi:hypothetical protein
MNQRALWADPKVRRERQARAEAFMGRPMEFDEETTMTRVTDEDLEWLAGYYLGDSSKAARIVREMRAELLALRKVADAAVRYHKTEAADEWRPYDDMVEALIEAGAL